MKRRTKQVAEKGRADCGRNVASRVRITNSVSATITFLLKPVPPFRLDLTVWALRRRSRNVIDRWDRMTYRRVLVFNRQPVEAAITQSGSPDSPSLQVRLTGQRITANLKTAAAKSLARLLGLRINLSDFYWRAATDTKFNLLAERFRGMKPLRFPTVNVYPGDDVGARNNLQRWLKHKEPRDYDGARRVTVRWQPYAGLVYFHMLLDRLDAAGHLGPESPTNELGGINDAG